ncbi:protein kinase domain-containing protein [Roseiconus lacunae]|uniref:Protein kinase n=1 Tax=Roseiconus lacunae TaxID=2605694 RepID=A0ABT7PE25_9BACT|nr:protein kinase [Roseiconus lacunae]MDM4014755.1 protein kinase [Roseiconus lacunae]
MKVICTYCGSECGDKEQQDGRCGSCACFFLGTEVVLQDQAATPSDPDHQIPTETPQAAPSTGEPSPPGTSVPKSELDALLESMMPEADAVLGSFNPNSIEPDLPSLSPDASEGLIQPRKLSPQYRKRVERTWESTFGGGAVSALHTLNSVSPSMGTKNECPTLSIATRKIFRAGDAEKSEIHGDYELSEVIGEGSMGRVWSAKQTSLDRNVAVKVPMAELAGSGSVGESQFISEVVVTGQLEHPNIVPIYELGRDVNGLPFYSMKHVQGQAWNETIHANTIQDNIEILMKVCDAIAFAHDRNFLHRDIKPHNVMVGEFGEVSVMDWGIAVAVTKDPNRPWASIATGPAGTPAYMAPEMAAHNPSELGVVSDIYLLGAVLYEIVTGTPPHPKTGDTRAALLAAAANEIIATTTTGELVDIARRAMATNLNDRYQSVQEFQDAIREYQSHRESIKLSESAREHYEGAVKNRSSDEFARARFAYEEALRLWDGNHAARKGLEVATIAHAKNALDQENYELGISILDVTEADHQDLLTQLESRRAQRRQLARVSKVAAAVAVAAVIAVIGVTFYSYGELKESAVQLQSEKEVAIEQRKIALTSAEEARRAETTARKAEKKAKSAERLALVAKNEARGAESKARQEKRRAEEAAYASEIGLAAESIRRNEFEKAQRILHKMDPASGESHNAVMSRLRHLEWGLLRAASAPATMQNLTEDIHVESVDSTKDGRVIVAGTDSGNLLVWKRDEHNSNAPPVRIAFGTAIGSVAVSEDGSQIAAGGIQTTTEDESRSVDRFAIKVWKLGSGDTLQSTQSLSGHRAAILSLQFSPDGKRLVSSASDRKAFVWDLSTGRPLSVMRDHLEKEVYDARFSPDGTQVVTACEDGRVRVWEIQRDGRDARKIGDFRGHEGPVYCVTFSDDGRSVMSGGYDQRLLQWKLANTTSAADQRTVQLDLIAENDRQSGAVLVGFDTQQHEASVRSIEIGTVDNQTFLVSGGNDNTIRVWKLTDSTWQLEKVLRGHGRWVRSCVFADQMNAVVSGAFDGVKRWSWRDYDLPRELYPVSERRLGKRPSEIGLSPVSKSMYSPDGKWVATAFQNGTVALWDQEQQDRSAGQLLGDGHALLTATGGFFDAGKQLLTSAGDNTSRIWDVERATQSHLLSGTGYRGVAAAFRQPEAGRTLVVTGSDDRLNPAKLWILNDDGRRSEFGLLRKHAAAQLVASYRSKLEGNGTSVTISRNLSDADFLQRRQSLRRIADITAVIGTKQAEAFLIGDSRGRCYLFRIRSQESSPELVSEFQAHASSISGLAISDRQNMIVTASEEGRVRLWRLDDATKISELPWSGPVTSIDLSSNGSLLIIGHSSILGRDAPIAEAYRLGEQTSPIKIASLQSLDHDATKSPTVQSIRFVDQRNAILSLYYPAGHHKSGPGPTAGSSGGYRTATWQFSDPAATLRMIDIAETGEIASASFLSGDIEKQLLTVGGKGARLWRSADEDPRRFTTLVKNFRPSASITSLGFSSNSDNRSERLAYGDVEGNVRIWQLQNNRWTETNGAAQNLSGAHDLPVVATEFDPSDPNRLLTADQSGRWILWTYHAKDRWVPIQEDLFTATDGNCSIAMFSPDGQRILSGGIGGGGCWKRNEAGTFVRSKIDWESGPISTMIISDHGRWCVTSDGDRNVAFWDRNLRLIARLDQDDALSVSCMDLSTDLRRFVTGQGKRIVIWDTSRLLSDTRNAEAAISHRHQISELLALEEHRSVAAVQFAPNGHDLLSAGSEGRTVIWEGKSIAPVAITTSTTQLAYQINSPPATVDASILLTDPSRLLANAALTLHIELDESLAVPPSDFTERCLLDFPLQSGMHFDERSGAITYQPTTDSPPLSIGFLESDGRNGRGQVIRFANLGDSLAVQSILRSLKYQASTASEKIKSGVRQDEEQRTIDVLIRPLSVRLELEYRSEQRKNQATPTPSPQTIEAHFDIEVDFSQSTNDLPIAKIDPAFESILSGPSLHSIN